MVKAAGYSRVSTEDQAQEGYSIEAQESVIRECCKNHGWEFFKLYSDPGISGTVPPEDRPGLAELMDDSKKSLFDIVLVVNFDRLSRDSGDAGYIRKELQYQGVKVAETSNPDIDSASSTGKFLFSVKGAFAELERDLISERTRRAMVKMKQKGLVTGRPRKGFKVGEDGKLALDELGEKGLKLLAINPSIRPQTMASELGISYKEAWNLSRNLRSSR